MRTKIEPAPLLTADETADYLRVTRATVFKLLRTGELPRIKIANSTRIPKAAIDRLLGLEVASS